MTHDEYKLKTRRYLAWGIVGSACLIGGFVAVWGAVKGVDSYVAIGAVGLLEMAAAAVGFYFARKLNEE